MTRKPNNSVVPEADSEFHAVEWVRRVRDEMYAATSGMSAEELIRFVRQAAAVTNSRAGSAGSGSGAHTA
jgi:hypothetical protein